MDTYEQKYKKALERAKKLQETCDSTAVVGWCEYIFPELKESKDEKTRKRIIALVNAHGQGMYKDDMLTWLENIPYTIDREKREGFHLGYKAGLEKQGEQEVNEPDWCHHKVDLSDCSEEYRKAYYDGWNNCNQQHSQCNAEQKSADKDMVEALRTEYEKGRADVIADTLSWLENCWPRYCSNQTIIEGFKEAIKGE